MVTADSKLCTRLQHTAATLSMSLGKQIRVPPQRYLGGESNRPPCQVCTAK